MFCEDSRLRMRSSSRWRGSCLVGAGPISHGFATLIIKHRSVEGQRRRLGRLRAALILKRSIRQSYGSALGPVENAEASRRVRGGPGRRGLMARALFQLGMGEGPAQGESRLAWSLSLERVTGIEPALSAWEADVLPLNYTRSAASLYPMCSAAAGAPRVSLRRRAASVSRQRQVRADGRTGSAKRTAEARRRGRGGAGWRSRSAARRAASRRPVRPGGTPAVG